MILRLKVPCKKPVAFLWNLRQSSKIFLLESTFDQIIVKSITAQLFYPLLLLTQNIRTLCSTMQPDLLLGNKHGGGYSAKGSLNPRRTPSKTNAGAFKVVFQKPMAELKRPFTPQLLFRILNSSKFPRKKTRKVITNLQMMIIIRH